MTKAEGATTAPGMVVVSDTISSSTKAVDTATPPPLCAHELVLIAITVTKDVTVI